MLLIKASTIEACQSNPKKRRSMTWSQTMITQETIKSILNRMRDNGDWAILCQVQDFECIAKPDLFRFLTNDMHITVRVFFFFNPAVHFRPVDQVVELI